MMVMMMMMMMMMKSASGETLWFAAGVHPAPKEVGEGGQVGWNFNAYSVAPSRPVPPLWVRCEFPSPACLRGAPRAPLRAPPRALAK